MTELQIAFVAYLVGVVFVIGLLVGAVLCSLLFAGFKE